MNLLHELQRARGAHLMLASAKAADTSGSNYLAVTQADLSKEQLAWAKQIYADSADERATATDLSNQLSASQLEASQLSNKQASQAYDDYQSTYRPLEMSMAQEAQNYDTPERRAAAAAAATSDVERNVSAQRGATMREMERSGVNPASGKAMALQGSMDLGASKLKAGAGTQAMRNVETIGAAKKADAVNLGRGIASSQATSAALALQQGNSAMANSNNAINTATAGSTGVQQGYAGAQSGLGSAAGTLGNIAGQQQTANNASAANTTAGVGAAASIAAMIFMSDKHKKKDITPTDPEEALEAVAKTPVSSWRYDPSKGGIDDGGMEHVGPMAQDVQAHMGDTVAPGGKVIDAISQNGIAMAAIQGLNLKVDKLAAAIKKPRGHAMALEH